MKALVRVSLFINLMHFRQSKGHAHVCVCVMCVHMHTHTCVRVCVHMHTGSRNRCMEHGRPEHAGTATLSMASPPLSSQLPFWSAPLPPPSIRPPHSRDPHLLVFSRTSTFFRSSKFSVEQDSTLQRRKKKENLSLSGEQALSQELGWRQVGFREKINREAATLGRSGRELGQPELGKRVRTHKKKKRERERD